MTGPPGRVGRSRPLLPGLLAAALACGFAFAAAHAVPGLSAATVAVTLGALVANVGLHRPTLRPGTRYAGRRVLRVAVVLLGLQLSLSRLADLGLGGVVLVLVTVTATFAGTQLLGRLLGVPPARRLLIAGGFSICGASAVAALEPVAGGDEQDTATAVALVTLCGSLAIVLLPSLQAPLGLDVPSFGAWVGASVHDVGQTAATAARVPGAAPTALAVKLSRVVLLAPLVAAVAWRRRRDGAAVGRAGTPPVPLFVAGFIAALLLSSTGVVPTGTLDAVKRLQEILLVAALFGLGTGIHVPTLVRTGGRSLALGLASWVLVGGIAWVGVRVLIAG